MVLRISTKVDNIISFLAGIIFWNGVVLLIGGQYFVSILSFLTIGVVVYMKLFVDWTLEE